MFPKEKERLCKHHIVIAAFNASNKLALQSVFSQNYVYFHKIICFSIDLWIFSQIWLIFSKFMVFLTDLCEFSQNWLIFRKFRRFSANSVNFS